MWNKTRRPLTLRLYGAGATVREGQYEVAAYEARSEGTGAWVAPERHEIRLGRHQDSVVPFTVHVPPVIGNGPRMAAVVAESDTGITQNGVEVVAQVGHAGQLPEGSSARWASRCGSGWPWPWWRWPPC